MDLLREILSSSCCFFFSLSLSLDFATRTFLSVVQWCFLVLPFPSRCSNYNRNPNSQQYCSCVLLTAYMQVVTHCMCREHWWGISSCWQSYVWLGLDHNWSRTCFVRSRLTRERDYMTFSTWAVRNCLVNQSVRVDRALLTRAAANWSWQCESVPMGFLQVPPPLRDLENKDTKGNQTGSKCMANSGIVNWQTHCNAVPRGTEFHLHQPASHRPGMTLMRVSVEPIVFSAMNQCRRKCCSWTRSRTSSMMSAPSESCGVSETRASWVSARCTPGADDTALWGFEEMLRVLVSIVFGESNAGPLFRARPHSQLDDFRCRYLVQTRVGPSTYNSGPSKQTWPSWSCLPLNERKINRKRL